MTKSFMETRLGLKPLSVLFIVSGVLFNSTAKSQQLYSLIPSDEVKCVTDTFYAEIGTVAKGIFQKSDVRAITYGGFYRQGAGGQIITDTMYVSVSQNSTFKNILDSMFISYYTSQLSNERFIDSLTQRYGNAKKNIRYVKIANADEYLVFLKLFVRIQYNESQIVTRYAQEVYSFINATTIQFEFREGHVFKPITCLYVYNKR